jgi:hypothetical protein
MEFFIPFVAEGSTVQQAWSAYLEMSELPPITRPVYSLAYEHGSSKFVVTVGKPRQEYKRKTGPRGGYIKDADYRGHAVAIGMEVTAIADPGGDLLFVWSMPPYRPWANPPW